MTVAEREAFSSALDKIKQVAKTDNYSTNNSLDAKLGKTLGSNLVKQEGIGKEIATTQQDITNINKALTHATTNSGSIDRNVNDQVIAQVMKTHPELRGKPQAAEWMAKHREETDAIARPIITSTVNQFASIGKNLADPAILNQKIKDVNDANNNANNAQITTGKDLENKYKDKAHNIEKQAAVKDSDGNAQPIEQVINNNINKAKESLEGDLDTQLNNRLTSDEQEELEKLNKVGGKNGTVVEKDAKVKKAFKDTDPVAAFRVIPHALEEIGLPPNNEENLKHKVKKQQPKEDD